jgi:hypothetical protein
MCQTVERWGLEGWYKRAAQRRGLKLRARVELHQGRAAKSVTKPENTGRRRKKGRALVWESKTGDVERS